MGFAYNIGSCSILMAKLWGIHSTMVMAKELGCRHLWVKSDSATAMDSMNQGVSPSHHCASLVMAIQDLWKDFSDVQITHVYREANTIADWFATHAFSYPIGIHRNISLWILRSRGSRKMKRKKKYCTR